MASLCLTPLPPPPPSQPRKLLEPNYSSSSSSSPSSSLNLKPIVVNGNPPTFVSAPGRRIVAGLFSLLLLFVLFLL